MIIHTNVLLPIPTQGPQCIQTGTTSYVILEHINTIQGYYITP